MEDANHTEAGYFSPTDVGVATQLLEMVDLKEGNVFVDAGGGDGRAVIHTHPA